MRRAKRIVRGLAAPRKTADAAMLAQARHAFASAGQDLVRIALVANVPDDPVARRIEYIVERDREFDRAEIRRQVAAGAGDRIDDEATQFIRQFGQAVATQLAEVPGVVDGFEQFM